MAMDMGSGATSTVMDMSMSMSMPSSSATPTAMGGMDMGGMGMGGDACRISVSSPIHFTLVDATSDGVGARIDALELVHRQCMSVPYSLQPRDRRRPSPQTRTSSLTLHPPGFISATWRITSPGMFAGSCIGVICLTASISFVRRLHRAYDAFLARGQRGGQPSGHAFARVFGNGRSVEHVEQADSISKDSSRISQTQQPLKDIQSPTSGPYRASLVQQLIRALLHMVQFGVAYFVMLLAMYYNGYFIICILIGAFLGYLAFEWEPIGV